MFAKLLALIRPKVFTIASTILLVAAILSQFDDLPVFQKYRTFFVFAGVILTIISAFIGVAKEMRPLVDDLLTGGPAPKWLKWLRAGGIYVRREEFLLLFFLLITLIVTLLTANIHSWFAAAVPVLTFRKGRTPSDLTPLPSRIPYLPGITRKHYKSDGAIALMTGNFGSNLIGTPIDPVVITPQISASSPDYFNIKIVGSTQGGFSIGMKPARTDGDPPYIWFDPQGIVSQGQAVFLNLISSQESLGALPRIFPILLSYEMEARLFAVTLIGSHAFAPTGRDVSVSTPSITQHHPLGVVSDSRFGDYVAASLASNDRVYTQPSKTLFFDLSNYSSLSSQDFAASVDVVIYDVDAPWTFSPIIDRGSIPDIVAHSFVRKHDFLQLPALRTIVGNSLYPQAKQSPDYHDEVTTAAFYGFTSPSDRSPLAGSLMGVPISSAKRLDVTGRHDITNAVFSDVKLYTPRNKQVAIEPLDKTFSSYSGSPQATGLGLKECGFMAPITPGILPTKNADRLLAQVTYELVCAEAPLRVPGMQPDRDYDSQTSLRVNIVGQGPNSGRFLTFTIRLNVLYREALVVDEEHAPDETTEIGQHDYSVLHLWLKSLSEAPIDQKIPAFLDSEILQWAHGDLTLLRAVTLQYDAASWTFSLPSPVGTTSRFNLRSTLVDKTDYYPQGVFQRALSSLSSDLVSPLFPNGKRMYSLGQPMFPVRLFVSPANFRGCVPVLQDGRARVRGKFEESPFIFAFHGQDLLTPTSQDMFGYALRVILDEYVWGGTFNINARQPQSVTFDQFIYDIAPCDSPSVPVTSEALDAFPVQYELTQVNLGGYNNDLGFIGPVNVPEKSDFWATGL